MLLVLKVQQNQSAIMTLNSQKTQNTYFFKKTKVLIRVA